MAGDPHYPDDIRMYDDDPRSPFYKSDPAEEEAADREERFRAASDELESIANWMSEVWDHAPCDARDDESLINDAEELVAALRVALTPWKPRIIAAEQKFRTKYEARTSMTLMGEVLPAIKKEPTDA